ncbi:hypothetical protein, partial [Mammaliicoccus sciuri]|uniref:hypothetical protein n=1 Tax=Mammaliicoccus sciuri TaxID=1296 RepID=UPI0019534798
AETSDFDLQDSFLDYDCELNCWTGKHLKYVFMTSVFSAVYSLVSIPCSTALNNSLEGLQLQASERYLVIRQPVVMILVAVYKSDHSMSDHARASVFLVVLGIYTLTCFKIGVVNIPSFNLRHNILLTSVVLTSILQALHLFVYANPLLWIALQLLVVLVLALVTFVISRRLRSCTI